MSKVDTNNGNDYDDLGFPEAKSMQANANIVASMRQVGNCTDLPTHLHST